MIVGDDRGGVHSLKLSPNLRKLALAEEEKGNEEEEGGEEEEGKELDNDAIQHKKMMKLLASTDKEADTD